MTSKELKTIFSIPEKDLLEFLLNKINLNDNDREIIDNYYLRGKAINEDLAFQLGISLKTLKTRYDKLKNKLSLVWEHDSIVKMILDR